MLKAIVTCSFLFCVLNGFSQIDSTRAWTVINLKSFTIEFPSDWVLDTSRQYGLDIIMQTYQETPLDSFSENVTVGSVTLDEESEGITPEQYVKNQEDAFHNMYTQFSIDEWAVLKKNDIDYHKWIYSATSENKRLKCEQYTFIQNKIVYIITLTAEAKTFEFYKRMGERILNSFTLK